MRTLQCTQCKVSLASLVGHKCAAAASRTAVVVPVNVFNPPAWWTSEPASVPKIDNTWMLRSANAGGISMQVRGAWDTLRGAFVNHGTDSFRQQMFGPGCPGDLTLAAFMQLSPPQQMDVIDRGWGILYAEAAPIVAFDAMVDPLVDGNTYRTSTKVSQAFKKMGIGFRCDRRPPEVVRQQGFMPRYRNVARAEADGHHIRGTIMTDNKMWLVRKNEDALGETCVCVARVLWGATKFPVQSETGQHYVYALRCRSGFDTESWQQSGACVKGVWRAGEKMLPRVNTSDVVASVPVTKHGWGSDGKGWKYEFDKAAQWTFYEVSSEEEAHLVESLSPLRGGIRDVSYRDDFKV